MSLHAVISANWNKTFVNLYPSKYRIYKSEKKIRNVNEFVFRNEFSLREILM